jgi:hypothetical protein
MPNDNQQDSNPLDQKQPAGLTGDGNSDAPEPTIPDFGETENVETPTGPTTPPVETPTESQDTDTKSEASESPKQDTQPQIDIPPVITTSVDSKNAKRSKGPKGKNVIAAVVGVFLLLGAVVSGIILTQQRQNISERAATGGEESPSPTATPELLTAACTEIKAYTVSGSLDNPDNWSLLSSQQLTQLASGDEVYFVARGSETSGQTHIDAAKITINGTQYNASIKNTGIECAALVGTPCPVEFYVKYTVKSTDTTFSLTATMHDAMSDSWF